MFSGPILSFLRTDWTRKAAALAAVAALGAAGCGGDLESRLAEIRSLQTAGDFQSSIEPLRGLVTTNSVHPEVNFRLGLALVQTGRQSLAIWPLQKAAGSDEFAGPAGILLINALIHTGDYEEAVRAADRVLAADPDNQLALSGRAQANLSSSNAESALTDAEHLLRLNPQDFRSLVLQSAALADLDRLNEAETVQLELERVAVEQGNTNQAARACASRGFLKTQTEAPESAAEVFKACAETYPGDPRVRKQATEFFVSEGDFASAVSLWRQAVEQNPEDSALRARLADLLRQAGELAEARAVFEEMVELFDSASAWRAMATFHRTTGNVAAAREALEQAIARSTDGGEALQFELADLWIEAGELDNAREVASQLTEPAYSLLLAGAIAMAEEDYTGALQHFESGLRRWPNNANARHLAGIAAEQLGDRTRAIAEYREAVRNDASRTDAALRLAQIHYEQGEFAAAREFANTHLNSRPFNSPDAHLLAARAAMRTGEFDESGRILRALLRRGGYEVPTLIELANLTARAEGPDQAILALQAAQEEEPAFSKSTEFQLTIARLLGEAGRPQEALVVVQTQLAVAPDDAVLEDYLGRLQLQQGRVPEARAAFERALANDAAAAAPHQGLGLIALATGDFASARGHFEAGAGKDRASGDFPYRLAQISLAEGDQAGAIESLRAAVEVEPAHLGANNDLAWLLAETGGDLELALQLAQRAVRIAPAPATHDTLGWVHLKRGDGDLAEQAFAKVIQANGETPSAVYHMALALEQQGRTADAAVLLEKALQAGSFPESEAASAALARVQGS